MAETDGLQKVKLMTAACNTLHQAMWKLEVLLGLQPLTRRGRQALSRPCFSEPNIHMQKARILGVEYHLC